MNKKYRLFFKNVYKIEIQIHLFIVSQKDQHKKEYHFSLESGLLEGFVLTYCCNRYARWYCIPLCYLHRYGTDSFGRSTPMPSLFRGPKSADQKERESV